MEALDQQLRKLHSNIEILSQHRKGLFGNTSFYQSCYAFVLILLDFKKKNCFRLLDKIPCFVDLNLWWCPVFLFISWMPHVQWNLVCFTHSSKYSSKATATWVDWVSVTAVSHSLHCERVGDCSLTYFSPLVTFIRLCWRFISSEGQKRWSSNWVCVAEHLKNKTSRSC